MTAPKRIQRQRTKGWRMPEDAIYVGRPTRWGNPYAVGEVNGWTGETIATREEARSCYAAELQTLQSFRAEDFELLVAEMRRELAGHDLVCWCPADSECHADVLLALANGEPA